ncbi:hypothetical protein C2S52_001867 [Perilla frutescens var. hirtella]|nr:hypothetical protein C2S52_001867 [Perilla frutescens var. hirtella]
MPLYHEVVGATSPPARIPCRVPLLPTLPSSGATCSETGAGHTRKRRAHHELNIDSQVQGKRARADASSSSRNVDAQEGLQEMREVIAEAALAAARTVAQREEALFERMKSVLTELVQPSVRPPSSSRSPVEACSAGVCARSPYSATKEADMERLVTSIGHDYIEDTLWNIQPTNQGILSHDIIWNCAQTSKYGQWAGTDRERVVERTNEACAIETRDTVAEEGMGVDTQNDVDVHREHDNTLLMDLVPNLGEGDALVGMNGESMILESVVEDVVMGSGVGEKDEGGGTLDCAIIATTVEGEPQWSGTVPTEMALGERPQELPFTNSVTTGERAVEMGDTGHTLVKKIVPELRDTGAVGEKIGELVMSVSAPTAVDLVPSGRLEMKQGDGSTGTGFHECGTDTPKELEVREGLTETERDMAAAAEKNKSKDCQIHLDSCDLNSGEGSDESDLESPPTDSVPRTLLLYSAFRAKGPDALTRLKRLLADEWVKRWPEDAKKFKTMPHPLGGFYDEWKWNDELIRTVQGTRQFAKPWKNTKFVSRIDILIKLPLTP